ncbi:MAG: phage portal protein [Bifidobacteriaceae bacterium]|jgi:HK97 family phage portal protein|nr:phage portal protein [Bifidobacteriaceae bacterium]
MGLRAWLGLGGAQQRAITFEDVFASGPGRESVWGDRVLRVAPVYSAVALIADQLASLPVGVFERTETARRPAPAPDWLQAPDPRVSRFDWMQQLALSVLLRGNAYGLVDEPGGVVSQVVWVHPDKVSIDESRALPLYHVGSGVETLRQFGGRLIHIRGAVMPGTVKGASPIELFRRRFATWSEAADFGADWFDGAAVPSGILKNTRGTLDPLRAEEAKARFKAATRRGEPVMLDQNWEWTQVSVSASDSQFLDTIKATATVIASIFRVDPEDIGGETGGSLTYSTVEGNQRKFNNRTLLPWCTRFESTLGQLFPANQFIKFNLDALARPNTAERVKANSEALRTGQIFHDELRALEDRPPATPEQVAFWRENYQTAKSVSESISESVAESVSITKEEG